MSVHSYRHNLAKALGQIQNKEAGMALWNFLYDWGNHLPTCVGKIRMAQLDSGLSQESKETLESVEESLKSLLEDMRGALVDYAENKASVST